MSRETGIQVAELSRTSCLFTGDFEVELVRLMTNLLFAFLPMTNQYLLSLSFFSYNSVNAGRSLENTRATIMSV